MSTVDLLDIKMCWSKDELWKFHCTVGEVLPRDRFKKDFSVLLVSDTTDLSDN